MNYEKKWGTHANKVITCSIEMINEWSRSILTYVSFLFLLNICRTIFIIKFSKPIIFGQCTKLNEDEKHVLKRMPCVFELCIMVYRRNINRISNYYYKI
jgi:hypothetical protein